MFIYYKLYCMLLCKCSQCNNKKINGKKEKKVLCPLHHNKGPCKNFRNKCCKKCLYCLRSSIYDSLQMTLDMTAKLLKDGLDLHWPVTMSFSLLVFLVIR